MDQENEVVFITGAAGMVGAHLVDYYKKILPRKNIIGSWFNPTIDLDDISGACSARKLDVRDAQKVFEFINRYRPSKIFHLAAQSYPTVSWEKPIETLDTNLHGTVNVFEAVKQIRKNDPHYDPMIIVACSSAEYGASLTPENSPVREETPLLPLHPYGVSKVGQDLLSFQYWKNFNLRCVRVRIFNTTGARKTGDVTSDFVQRAFEISKGAENIFRAGNLEAKRAITDVRDLVNAMVLLSERGKPGDVYNVSGDKVYQVKEIIPLIEKAVGIKLNVQVDSALLRPSDEPIIYGDSSKLKRDTGWQQKFSLEETIVAMFQYLISKNR